MSLLELVKKNKEMRRLFGEKELKIIEKQLMGVNLSPSERTRISRDIRPKFEIISELADFKNEFELKKSQEIKFLIEQAKETILESTYSSKIRKIVLFGSYVENKMRFDSDVDVSVEFDSIAEKEAGKFRLEMSVKINKKIQVQVFNVLPEKIQKEILDKGRVIYEQN
jgi:predicted nucleotidyltransferase